MRHARKHGRAATTSRGGARPARGRGFAPKPKGLIWRGTISFGLVNIPVSLHAGRTAAGLHFTLLDRRDLSPIGYKKINKNTGAEVPAAQIVKGYKYGEDEYVTLGDEDFRRASPELTQRIDLSAFVDAKDIDPALFDRPYFLEPAAKSDKAYALLREALRRSGKVGIATVVLRARQHLAALFVRGRALTLELLRYGGELRDPEELRLPDDDLRRLKISDAELKMAERLIEELGAPWRPGQYKDEYRDKLLAFIEAKARAGKAKPITAASPKTRPAAAPVDIMNLLRKSLAKGEALRHTH